MSLVFSAFTPNLPLILPPRQAGETPSATAAACKELEGELYVMQPDTLFIISSEAPLAKDAFLINLSSEYFANLYETDPKPIHLTYTCDIELISKIREYCDRNNYGLANIISQAVLDLGAVVPLFYLTQHLPRVKIIPISLSLASPQEHYRFGHVLRHVAQESNKRVAIIGAAQLSNHQATKGDATTFDNTVLDLLKHENFKQILKINDTIISGAQAVNGHKTLALLLGVLNDLCAQPVILSYERLSNTGLLVAQFNLI